ncbi:MAG: hypothetical protein M0009_11825 [Deltaproteobacteria bacterium]|nr:hypothetical protein [Deltaproteobacteria bacterium]
MGIMGYVSWRLLLIGVGRCFIPTLPAGTVKKAAILRSRSASTVFSNQRMMKLVRQRPKNVQQGTMDNLKGKLNIQGCKMRFK